MAKVFFFFLITVDVRTNLCAPRLISRDPEVYGRVLISIALRGFELVTIGEQINQ